MSWETGTFGSSPVERIQWLDRPQRDRHVFQSASTDFRVKTMKKSTSDLSASWRRPSDRILSIYEGNCLSSSAANAAGVSYPRDECGLSWM
jgi:hypothetical protein